MAYLRLYVVIWAAWTAWVQSVGRIPGALGLPATLVFDALAVVFILRGVFTRGRASGSISSVFGLRTPDRDLLTWLALALIASMLFTAIFQVPFDWDGMDYHLPPIVEAWMRGFWGRSANPYFAARSYPKTAGMPYLWWLCHFGKALGMRGMLLVPLLHWLAGLAASSAIFGRSRWVFLFWAALPLVAREGVSAYADLPGLSTLLAFALFALRREYAFAAAAIALHGSLKFTNLATASAALAVVAMLRRRDLRAVALVAAACVAAAVIQPIENYRAEGKLFGPLQCRLFGRDFCGGSVDPGDFVVSPTLDFPREQPWLVKVARGWSPAQIVPGTDVAFGGFGWAWVLPVVAMLAARRRWTWPPRPEDRLAAEALIVVGIADFSVPALWYSRYHMALGWVLAMIAARWMRTAGRKTVFRVSAALVALQLAWLIPQRAWFLGWHDHRGARVLGENLFSIVTHGYPARASHQADQRSLALFPLQSKRIEICGDAVRPSLAGYGVSLTNEVRWYGVPGAPACPFPEKEVWHAK